MITIDTQYAIRFEKWRRLFAFFVFKSHVTREFQAPATRRLHHFRYLLVGNFSHTSLLYLVKPRFQRAQEIHKFVNHGVNNKKCSLNQRYMIFWVACSAAMHFAWRSLHVHVCCSGKLQIILENISIFLLIRDSFRLKPRGANPRGDDGCHAVTAEVPVSKFFLYDSCEDVD